MRKIFIIFILILFTTSNAFAYTPTDNEIKLLSKLKQNTIIKSKIKWQTWLEKDVTSLEKSLAKSNDERIKYLLLQVIKDKKSILDEIIKQKKEKKESNYKIKVGDFFGTYWKDITTDLKVSEKCTKYFDFIDNIATLNNFPTELIIATWGKEYNCNLSNPNNWYWPFQISSKYYQPGDITLEQFAVSIQDYINFSKNKWNYFNTNTYHDYKTRFWSWNIEITYDNYTLRELRLNSILFNWIKKDTTLDKNTFANDNLNKDIVSNSDWLVTRFLKILKWRTE